MTGSLVTPGTRDRVRGLATPVATALGRLGLTPNALTISIIGVILQLIVSARCLCHSVLGVINASPRSCICIHDEVAGVVVTHS